MKLKKFIMATWEFPQNALGFVVKKIFEATPYTKYKDATVYNWNISSGAMSLGKYIFVPFRYSDPNTDIVQRTIKHEYGHTRQSKRLGWLYLLVIGLPSLIWAKCGNGYRAKTGKSYYGFYTEAWADKLGGVERSEE